MVTLVNRAKVATATTGTGTLTLGSAESGYQSFADAGVVDTDVVRYVIEDGTDWEIGTGTYSAGTLTRTVLESSNADAALNLTGSAVVYVSATAEDIPTAYTEADVDTHLNTGTAASGEVLSWTGTDYDWIAVGGGGSLSAASISGASQTVDFSAADIFVSTVDQNVTYTFSNASAVDKVDLVIDYQAIGGFSLSDAVYTGKKFSVSANDSAPQGLFFKSDGTKMYIMGGTTDAIYQYSLSIAWDISSASYDSISFSVSLQETSPSGLFFKPDGTGMFITGIQNNEVNQYSLSSAWDISTASFVRLFTDASRLVGPTDVFFKSDGTKMYIVDDQVDKIFQYGLSTAWSINTASFEAELPTADQPTPSGLSFTPDGSKLFVIGWFSDLIIQYNLSTAWDISTATQSSNSLLVRDVEGSPSGLFFKPDDGKKLYITGYAGDVVAEYDSLQGATLTFPSSVELPEIQSAPDKKFAITLITTDGGTSYQAVSQSGPIS
jgi:hypothetical protein